MDFKQTHDYVKNNKKLDINKFDKVSDITNMIDYLNEERTKEIEKDTDRDVHEISKFLVDIMTRKSFVIRKKP